MNYSQLLDKLFAEYKFNPYSFSQKYGGTDVTYRNILEGKTLNVTYKVKKRIEEAFNIKINDSDPHNIVYMSSKPIKEDLPPGHEFTDTRPAYRYPLIATVYAGEPALLDHEHVDEYSYFPYRKNNHRCFAVRVNGKSMETTIQDGAEVLVDMDAQLADGCLVAVKLKNGNQYLKRYYNLNYVFIKLSSDNPEYGVRLIDKTDILVCYRVVMINLPI